MSIVIREGRLTFTFPARWAADTYDQWGFYRKHFGKVCHETKAVDILALEPGNHCAWLIEIKDYRRYRRTKPLDLAEEISCKVQATLAGLACARINANIDREKELAKKAMRAQKMRVVLHLEQPAKSSKLYPRAIDPADVLIKLKTKIKAVAPHPLVVERGASASRVDWTVA